MSDCIFCDIINNKIPSWIVYQDKEVICFLPKSPEAYGHTIIAPKQHITNIFNAPEFVLENMIVVSQKLAIHYKSLISSTGLNLLHASGVSAQQSVLHLHIHLIPRFNNDGLNAWPEFPPVLFDKDEMWNKLKL